MRLITLLLLLASLLACAPRPASSSDTLLFGGPIYTGEDALPREALLIREGRVAFVGPLAEAEKRASQSVARLDLKGAAAFPGFVDAHAHLRGVGERELTLNLEGAASIADLQARVKAFAAAHPEDGLITGRGWIETHWPEARFPTAADLDAAVPERPVLLVRADGHALAANSKALALAGITSRTPDPAGGAVLRGPDGTPTGMLIDNAMQLTAKLRPAISAQARRRALEAGLEVTASRGWVGMHNMSVPWEDVLALEALAAEAAPLRLRVYNAVTPEAWPNLLASGARTAGGDRVRTRAVKVYADGALGSRGAALFKPYADANTTGLLLLDRKRATKIYAEAGKAGLQVATHAIGDQANALVLDWYAETLGQTPRNARAIAEPRWRIEHAQVLQPGDLQRFQTLGVVASMQPSHAISDLYFAEARLGPERLAGAYAWRSLLNSGAIIAGGSDAPVERGDPLIEYYAAVVRKDLAGRSGPSWHPEQAVTRLQALHMFTTAPAYAAFEENERGTLSPGRFADISVFDVDLMRADPGAILKGRALLTLIEGEAAYRAPDW